MKFKEGSSFSVRKDEASRILAKYPDRIPCVVEKANENDDIPKIDKTKYLVPTELTVGQFLYVIRKRIRLPPEKAIFIFVAGTIPASSATMSTIYELHHDDDGFLYLSYSGENTFGNKK